MIIRGLTLIFLLCLAACGEARIDASTEQSFKESSTKVRDALAPAKRDAFDAAMGTVVMGEVGSLFASAMSGAAPESPESGLYTKLDGKTAGEVIALSEQMIAERKAKEREQAQQEIAEIQAELAEAEKAKGALAAFVVDRSRYSVRDGSFSKEAIIELTVTNGLDVAVSRSYFHGVVASPDRSVPWISQDFNYSIKGGIEPGESMSWSLAPNIFSGWSTDVPADAVFTVTVTGLDGPDGEALYKYDTKALERKRDRLKVLQEQYGS